MPELSRTFDQISIWALPLTFIVAGALFGYMIERVSEEFFGSMKMITGSVFMIRAEILRKLGWTNSITEDWDLTLRMYMDGWKVLYTPLIQAPAEIPTTVRAIARQRMRWAEGHTFAVKKYFWDVLRSPNLTRRARR